MKIMNRILLSGAALGFAGAAWAQQNDFASVEIIPHLAGGNVQYLEGQGGNIGLSIGDDGVVMVDDQFAPLTEKILAAIASLTDEPVRFVINTHIHGDHTGGNENLGNMGVPIMSHDNVRLRMVQAAAPEAARPILTYADSVNMHINGEEISLIKLPPAHTDGDTVVHFKTSNVLHTGDVFRTGAFPVIDVGNGGSARGTIAALQRIVAIAGPNTVILPGHGQPSTVADVRSFLDMVVDVEGTVSDLIEGGMSLEQIIAADPTAAYADRGLGSPERFLTGLYDSLTAD